MSEKPFRKPNALKRGAFSAVALMPWENPSEFEELRRRLFEEFQPEGPLQEDSVNSILSGMWRKRRVSAKRLLDMAAELDKAHNRNLWEDPPPFFETEREGLIYSLSNRRREKAPPLFGGLPAPEGYAQLLGFSTRLYGNTSESLLKFMMRSLPDEFRQHLEEKVPLENFDSTTEWIFALKSEVDNVLLPMVRGREPKASGYAAAASEFLTDDRIIEDLAIEERLDAHIDRAMKRLFQLKLGRQLHAKVQPKMVVNKKLNQIEHDPQTPVDSKAL